MPCEAQVKNFLFRTKVMFHSRDIQVFVFLTFPWFTESVTPWWVLAHKTVHFWIYLLNYNSITHQTRSIDRYRQGQYFSEIFRTIGRTGAKFQALFNLAICSNHSINNYAKFPVFHFFFFFWKVYKGELKMVNINYWKLKDLVTLTFH